MQKSTILICLIAVTIANIFTSSFAARDESVAYWKFDEGKGKHAIDKVTDQRDKINGNFWYVPEVSGSAIATRLKAVILLSGSKLNRQRN